MLRLIEAGALAIFLGLSMIAVDHPLEAQAQSVTAGPVPAAIVNAKTVFLSNAGVRGGSAYSGGPNRPYDEFYAALKQWGRYDLVPAPAGADLIFEVSCDMLAGPQINLRVVDPRTHALLWTLGLVVGTPLSGNIKARDKKFDQAIANLVTDLKTLAAPPKVPSDGGHN